MAHTLANHLIHETSPYLLQHAYNPVEWFAWNTTAFDKAKKENKPILVSIGYAACHWCHVMEHESFEDDKVAAFMNTHFINIKVDREERPDVDLIYMNACQILTGAGGWPLNMFLTPDLKPFTGGTYFPPKPKYGKPSWLEVLMYVKDIFEKESSKVETQAELLSQHILKMNDTPVTEKIDMPQGSNTDIITKEEINIIVSQIKQSFDVVDGGFGSAPKFPGTMTLKFLLQYNFYNQDKDISSHIHLSLHNMMHGGIFDHVGGGFSRYTVDSKWMIPHFEKMLYDNALLVSIYAQAGLATHEKKYTSVVEKTLQFIERDMMSDEYGFYSSYDADSEGVEGKFYTWSKNEINSILKSDAPFACSYYNITDEGNWEQTNILFTNGTDTSEKIKSINNKLFQEREKRIKPSLDDKIILSWNALMASAYVHAFRLTDNAHYKLIACNNLTFLIEKMQVKLTCKFYHSRRQNINTQPAFLDDYAALIQALIDYYEISADFEKLDLACQLNQYVLEEFQDGDYLFFYTSKEQTDIPLRSKEYYDNATPSGNSIMLNNLIRLYSITGNQSYHEHASAMVVRIKQALAKYPTSYGNWLSSVLCFIYKYAEIAVVGQQANNVINEISKIYYPFAVYMIDNTGSHQKYAPLKNKFHPEHTYIYVCHNSNCHLPVKNVEDYAQLMHQFCNP